MYITKRLKFSTAMKLLGTAVVVVVVGLTGYLVRQHNNLHTKTSSPVSFKVINEPNADSLFLNEPLRIPYNDPNKSFEVRGKYVRIPFGGSGYSAQKVLSATQTPSGVLIQTSENAPGSNCIVVSIEITPTITIELTTPFHGPIQVHDNPHAINCSDQVE